MRKAWPSLLEQEKGASPGDSRLGAATQRAGEHLDGVTGAAHGREPVCGRGFETPETPAKWAKPQGGSSTVDSWGF